MQAHLKKVLLILGFIGILLNFTRVSLGQQQLEHKKKWFIDKDGRFYTNKHLPVYFRISHSPDEKAPSHLLKSESMPQYTNPMYLDIEGYNTLRSPSAVDTVTKQTVIPKMDVRFEIYADGKPPVSSSIFTEATKYINSDGVVYYGKGLVVNLSSNDAVSGVESIYYSINGAPYQLYSNQISVANESEYELKYYGVDNVGNAEKPQIKKFIVDTSSPITTQTVNGEIINDIISPNASVILTCEDNLSGVKKIMYHFDNEEPRIYTRPISLNHLKDGQQKLTYYAIDNVNNFENEETNKHEKTKGERVVYNFYLDKSVPFTSASIIGDQHSGKHVYISERSKIKLESTDNKGGVNRINYGINEAASINVYKEPFSIPNKKALYYVNFTATDNVKNVTQNNVFPVYMDNELPQSKLSIGLPKFSNRDSIFITKNSKINIYSVDLDSKVKTIEYAIDDGPFKNYEEFTVQEEGFHKIKYRATDNVNNQEIVKTQEVVVDNNSPEIFAVFSVNEIGKDTKEGKVYAVYPTYTRIFMAATDRYSGTEELWYSINGGHLRNYLKEVNISETNMLTKEGFYTIKIIAKDKLQNTSEKTIQFFTKQSVISDKK